MSTPAGACSMAVQITFKLAILIGMAPSTKLTWLHIKTVCNSSNRFILQAQDSLNLLLKSEAIVVIVEHGWQFQTIRKESVHGGLY